MISHIPYIVDISTNTIITVKESLYEGLDLGDVVDAFHAQGATETIDYGDLTVVYEDMNRSKATTYARGTIAYVHYMRGL